MTKRRTFSAKFKSQVVLAILQGTQSAAEICREHRLKPQLVSGWKAFFLERAAEVFSGNREQQALAARITELEGLVGRQALELEMLKKAWEKLGLAPHKSAR
jgi:putative transposase